MAKKKMEESTQRDLIQRVARQIGNWRRPHEYITAIKDEFGIDVSNSQITRSLGNYWARVNCDEEGLLSIAKQLVHACHNDKSLAKYTISRCGFSK